MTTSLSLSLAQYLNTSSARTATSALFGSSAGDTASASLLGGSTASYAFVTDSTGKPVIATLADMAAVRQPKDKLTIAGQVAESLRMQSDSAVKTRRADRLADMTGQTKSLVDGIKAAVDSLSSSTSTAASTKADPAVKPYQATISTALGRIASVMANLKALTPKASSAVASQTTATLTQLNTTAAAIASRAGLDWNTIAKTGSAGTTASVATATRLADYLV